MAHIDVGVDDEDRTFPQRRPAGLFRSMQPVGGSVGVGGARPLAARARQPDPTDLSASTTRSGSRRRFDFGCRSGWCRIVDVELWFELGSI